MCGRYASSRSPEDLAEEFEALEVRSERLIEPSWNVAPTDPVYAVVERVPRSAADPERRGEPVRQIRSLRWGLVPSWAKDVSIGARMINARMETVGQKPAFRKAFASRRCIVPADGYYEWYVGEQSSGRGKPRKQPFFIRPEDGSVLAMAGLYEIWRDPAQPEDAPEAFRWTCTVLTTAATDDLGQIHDRMPMLVPRAARDEWLDPRHPVTDLPSLLVPAQHSGLTSYPVSSAVGNVANDGPELIEPLALDRLGETDRPDHHDGQGTLL